MHEHNVLKEIEKSIFQYRDGLIDLDECLRWIVATASGALNNVKQHGEKTASMRSHIKLVGSPRTESAIRRFTKLVIEAGVTPGDWRSRTDAAFESDIEALVSEPEYRSIDAFISSKLDNDDYSFSTIELQALARNIDAGRLGHGVNTASLATLKSVKHDLINFGLDFSPREPVKFTRGTQSSAHGTHPFAGSGGGGSGFGSDFGGTTFTSYGGGPGAIGGGYSWKSGDKRNLKMGTARRPR